MRIFDLKTIPYKFNENKKIYVFIFFYNCKLYSSLNKIYKYINKIIVMIQKGTISLGALYKFSPHFLQMDDVV